MSGMNKTEAASFLGCSVRAVERYAAAGRLTGRYERGATGKVLVFDALEVETFKAELETPQPRAVTKAVTLDAAPNSDNARDNARGLDNSDSTDATPSSDSTSLATLVEAPNAPLALQLLASLQAIATSLDDARGAPTVPIADKPLLKLNEAALLTGLSRTTLRTAIADNGLKATLIGRTWRIRRADLDAYLKKL